MDPSPGVSSVEYQTERRADRPIPALALGDVIVDFPMYRARYRNHGCRKVELDPRLRGKVDGMMDFGLVPEYLARRALHERIQHVRMDRLSRIRHVGYVSTSVLDSFHATEATFPAQVGVVGPIQPGPTCQLPSSISDGIAGPISPSPLLESPWPTSGIS